MQRTPAVGLSLGLGSLPSAIAPLAFVLAADRWYIPFEEKQMRQIFHEQYEDYSGQVRRWLGRRTVGVK